MQSSTQINILGCMMIHQQVEFSYRLQISQQQCFLANKLGMYLSWFNPCQQLSTSQNVLQNVLAQFTTLDKSHLQFRQIYSGNCLYKKNRTVCFSKTDEVNTSVLFNSSLKKWWETRMRFGSATDPLFRIAILKFSFLLEMKFSHHQFRHSRILL